MAREVFVPQTLIMLKLNTKTMGKPIELRRGYGAEIPVITAYTDPSILP